MEKNKFKSIASSSNQAPLRGNPNLLQPYDTNKINMVLEQPMPIIPILVNELRGCHDQEMVPMQNKNAIVTNTLSDKLNLTPENSLTNQGHRRFYSELPPFQNDSYCGSNFDSTSDGANTFGNDILIPDDFDHETFCKFFDLYESDNSTPSTFQVEEQPNANVSRSAPPLPSLSHTPPSLSSTPIGFDLGMSSIPPSFRFNANGGILSAGLSTQQIDSYMHHLSQPLDKTVNISLKGMHAASSSSCPANRPFMEGKMKHYSTDDLAEIFRVDPRRAKRKAVAKIKDRNERYKVELENKLRILQARVPALRSQFAMMKNQMDSLAKENRQLQLQILTVEQKFDEQEELTKRLRAEIQRLKLLANHSTNAGILF